jgi:transposase
MRTSKSPVELGLTRRDRLRLEKALREASDARDFRRLQAVLLIAQGRPIEEVAQITCARRRSVYGWLRRYLVGHRVDDLMEQPRSGRPAAAAVITDERIQHELHKDPMTLGYSTTTWTVKLLATCEPTTHRRAKKVTRPPQHHPVECLREPPAAA